MKIQKATLLRRQWNELLAAWRFSAIPQSEFQSILEKEQISLDIPIGMLAGIGMQRREEPFVQCGIVSLNGRACVLIEAGRSGELTRLDSIAVKKILRAQDIALSGGLPLAFVWFGRCELADDDLEIFPDSDAAGNILAKAARMNTRRIPQFLLSETATGLGQLLGAISEVPGSGTVTEFSSAVGSMPVTRFVSWLSDLTPLPQTREPAVPQSGDFKGALSPEWPSQVAQTENNGRPDLTDIIPLNPSEEYDTREVIAALVDDSDFLEYRSEFGRTLLCGYASVNGLHLGIVANQRRHIRQPGHPFEFGGVIYAESADKGARFILDCNQNRLPLLFIQDVNGFMVGREAEIAGIIRSGAKMVNAVANSVVPKITLIIGGSYGAGNYALCGKAYDPLFIFGWPTARYAVMGGDQAARTLTQLQIRQAEASGAQLSAQERNRLLEHVKQTYEEQLDPRYAAARLWIDHVVFPGETRAILSRALQIAHYSPCRAPLLTGVIQT